MSTHKSTELKLLRHTLYDKASCAKIMAQQLQTKHFTYTDPEAPQPGHSYHGDIFQKALEYFTESQGSLLVRSVLENNLVASGFSSEDRAYFLQVWQEIQEEDLDENELYALITATKQRRAWRLYQKILQEGFQQVETEGLEGGLKYVRQLVFEAEQELTSNEHKQQFDANSSESITDFFSEYEDRFENPAKYAGVKCGIGAIDAATQGFTPAQLIVLLAKSGGGKSTQMLNWAMYANHRQNKKVLYFSFEMDHQMCWNRHLSLRYKIPYSEIKGVTIPPVELQGRIKMLSGGSNYFEYDVNMEDPTVEYVEARINELIMTKGKPDFVICDYVGNMYTRADLGKNLKEFEKVGNVATGLHALAKKYNIPVLTAQQLNRDGLKETRNTKATGKFAEVHQDMIASSKKLYDLATYVFYVEADVENKLSIYRSVKMRDGGHIIPAFARYDSIHHGVYDLAPEEQEHFRRVYQCYGAGDSSDAESMKGVQEDIETGSKTVTWDGGADTFEKTDYVVNQSTDLSDDDDW